MTDESTDIVEYLRRNAVFNYKDTYIAAADEIERLRKERDEARRMVCELDADIMEDRLEYARHRGWDCYPKLKEKP